MTTEELRAKVIAAVITEEWIDRIQEALITEDFSQLNPFERVVAERMVHVTLYGDREINHKGGDDAGVSRS